MADSRSISACERCVSAGRIGSTGILLGDKNRRNNGNTDIDDSGEAAIVNAGLIDSDDTGIAAGSWWGKHPTCSNDVLRPFRRAP